VLHWVLWHCVVLCTVQSPAMLHTDAVVIAPPVQLAGTQVVIPSGYLHWVRENVASQVPRQASRTPRQGARKVPRGALLTAIHLPLFPVSAHASHCPAHRVSQQTPSTQAWLVHSTFRTHASPLAFKVLHWFVPGSQYCVAAQGCVALHPPAHCIPSAAHRFEVQATPVTTVQAPLPLQVDATLATPPVQLAATHCFSAAA
jgi:hypothetical protein